MMAATISTDTTFYFTDVPGRNMTWSADGTLWHAAYWMSGSNSSIRLFYSTDGGATWAENTSADINTSSPSYITGHSFVIDSDDHAHIFYTSTTATDSTLTYAHMTAISPTASWASTTQVDSTGDENITLQRPTAVAFPTTGGARKAFCLYDGPDNNPAYRWYVVLGQASITSGGSVTAGMDRVIAEHVIPGGGWGVAQAVGLDFHHTTADPKQVQGSTPHLYAAWQWAQASASRAFYTYMTKLSYSGGTWTTGTTRGMGSWAQAGTTGFSVRTAMLFDGSEVIVGDESPTDVNLYRRDAADTTTTAITASSLSTDPTLCGLTYDVDRNLWLTGSYSSSLRTRQWLRSSTTWQTNINIEAEALTEQPAQVSTRAKGAALLVAFQGTSNYLRFDSYDVPTAPTAPTWVSPVDFAGADVGASLVLDWTFNDINSADTQGKYAVSRQIGSGTVYYWRASDSTWQLTETANVSSTTSLTLSSGWGSDGDDNHKFACKAWDAGYLEGVYGAELTVVPSTPDLPTITSPADASTWVTSSLTVVWTVASQSTYLVELLDSAGTTTLWSSGTLTSTSVREMVVDYTVLDGVSYKARVTTANDEGLVGTADTNSFDVSYTAPATPTLVVTADTPTGAVTVAHTNPTPSGGQPDVLSASVYVRCTTGTYADGERPVGGDGIRVKTGLVPGVDWIDYAPASGRAYEYLVRAYGDNGTTSDSAWTA